MAAQNCIAEAIKIGKSSEQERKQIETRIAQIDNTIRCLYEDRVIGRITPERVHINRNARISKRIFRRTRRKFADVLYVHIMRFKNFQRSYAENPP